MVRNKRFSQKLSGPIFKNKYNGHWYLGITRADPDPVLPLKVPDPDPAKMSGFDWIRISNAAMGRGGCPRCTITILTVVSGCPNLGIWRSV
jgi:hypothetical protein